jgi:hypothetical protein
MEPDPPLRQPVMQYHYWPENNQQASRVYSGLLPMTLSGGPAWCFSVIEDGGSSLFTTCYSMSR